ncbi:hypothetical protein GOODEAATRI_018959, partial [Goodea atripinnis]
CKGCTKWIHQSCLQRWLDEKQKGNSGGAVNCPQCGTEYCIIFPKMGEERPMIQPPTGVFPAAGRQSSVPCESLRCCRSGSWDCILVSSHLWSGDSHAGTLNQLCLRKLNLPTELLLLQHLHPTLLPLQVVGHKKGLFVMERADPLFLLMGLPTIPVLLVLGKMIRWEDYLLRLWQRHTCERSPAPGMQHADQQHVFLPHLTPVTC